MAFNENVEVISPDFGDNSTNQAAAEEAKRLQKQKWWVLTATFVIVLGISLSWVWSRSPIYQSQAIIHFSYAQPLNNDQSAVPEEQITLNAKRLTSNRILDSLKQQLNEQYSLTFSTQELATMLSTEEQLSSRVINLFATSENANILYPVMEQWLALYLDSLAEETVENTEQDISLGEQKLVALEEKIIEQRELVEQYSEQNNIISVERDENRALSKIKSLGSALDEAENQQAEASASLQSVRQSIEAGELVTHPADKARLDSLNSSIRDSRSVLARLAQQYTEEYMNFDPDIKRQRRNLEDMETRLLEVTAESQQRYLEDLQRTVIASKNKQQQLEQQLDELGKEAQIFNQKLQEYSRQTRSLRQLEEQAQELRDQLVETEVQKPFEAKINVLEEPFVPSYPIAPHYWRDTGIAIAGATLLSIFALFIVSFINRQKQPAPTMTSYTVVPPSGLSLSQAQQHQALDQQRMALGQQSTQLQLGQSESGTAAAQARLLSEMECKALYQVANRDGKLAMGLILNGVSPDELMTLKVEHIQAQEAQLNVPGEYARQVSINSDCTEMLAAMSVNQQPEQALFAQRLTPSQLDQMMINMAHDAGLAFAEQFSLNALRHTYLTFLVAQGARLNDLEQVAGYVSPDELSIYRQVNRRGEPVDIDALDCQYPVT